MRQVNRRGLAKLAAGLVLILFTGALLGGEPSRKELEKELSNSLRNIINQGADLFNTPNNKHEACVKLFEGSLTSIRPFLGHHPDLQKSIDAALTKAKGEQAILAAFTLRKTLDEVRTKLKDSTGTAAAPAKPDPTAKKLWDRLGGEVVVGKVIDEFFATAGKDPKVNLTRDGQFTGDGKQSKKLILALLSSLTEGPLQYDGKAMKDAHKGMKIKDSEFDAGVDHFKKALEKFNVAAADVNATIAVLGGMKKDVVEADVKVTQPDPTAKKLWDRLGGEEVVGMILDDFFANAGKDPKVNADRDGKFPHTPAVVKRLKRQFIEFLSDATEGPYKYKGKDMKEAHKGMKIKESEFEAGGGHFKNAMEKFKVAAPDVNAVMTILGSFKKDIVEADVKVAQPDPTAKKLWDRLGGEEVVGKILDDFFANAGKDPKVNADRDGAFPHTPAVVKRLKRQFIEFLSDATEGPYKYKGKDMKEAHKGMKIKESEFEAGGGHFKNAMEKFKVAAPDVNAVMTILGSFKKDIVEAAAVPAKPDPTAKKLWDRLGGEEVVGQILDDFFANAGKDPKVNADRDGAFPHTPAVVKRLKRQFIEFLSDATEGPYKYKGKNMKDAHKGMKIKDSEFEAGGGHFKNAMEKFKVAATDVNAVMTILGSFKKDIVEAAAPPEAKKLWERLGDLVMVKKITEQYMTDVAADPKVDFTRKDKFAIDKKRFMNDLTALISQQSGGPFSPAGKLEGGFGLSAAEKDAAVAIFKKTLKDLKVADADAAELSNKIDADLRAFVDAKNYRTEAKKNPDDNKIEPSRNGEPGRVSGRVVINGKVANIGYVLLQNDTTKKSFGTYITSDGSYGFKIEIPAGTYKVAVQPTNDPKTDEPLKGAVPIPTRYHAPATSDLIFEVRSGNNSLNLELKN